MSQEKTDIQQSITKDMLIQEVVEKHPEIVSVLLDYGLYCVGCYVSGMETLEEGAKGHGMSDDEVENMIADANDALVKKT